MRIQFKTSYTDDIRIFEDRRHFLWYALLVVAAIAMPAVLDEYYLGELTYVLIFALAGLGLMLLVGHTGLVSLGHAAFLATGAYCDVILVERGVPFILALPLAGLFSGVVGAILAFPLLRLKGIYLAIATMALAIIIEDVIVLAEPLTGGVIGLVAPPIVLFGLEVDRYGTPSQFYYVCLAVVFVATLGYVNLLRSPTGRAFTAIRDSEVSAGALGINVAVYKTLSFGISCFFTGLAGGLLAHFLGAFNHETFLIITSILLLMMVVVGGMGSIHGAFFGAAMIGLLPPAITILREEISALTGGSLSAIPGLDTGLFAAVLVAFILFEPMGIYGRWLKIRTFFQVFPLYRKNLFRRQKTFLRTERMR